MSNWKLRVDGSWHDVSSAMLQVSEKCVKAVFYEHPSTGSKCVHVHGLIWGYAQKEDTLRNKCKAISKGSYEASQNQRKKGPPVDEGFISYMSKGKYDPQHLKGWTQEQIDVLKAAGYDKDSQVPIVVQSATSVASPIVIKPKKQTSEEKMNAWLVHECGWKLGSQFTLSHLEKACASRQEPIRNNRALQLVCGGIIRPQVIAYANGRVHNQQLIAMVRNALWNFSDEDVREVIKESLCAEIMFA